MNTWSTGKVLKNYLNQQSLHTNPVLAGMKTLDIAPRNVTEMTG